ATYMVERGNVTRFSADSRFLIVTQAAPYAEIRAVRTPGASARPAGPGTGGKAPVRAGPAGSLVVLDLRSGQKFEKPRVSVTRMALHDKGWLAYQLAP